MSGSKLQQYHFSSKVAGVMDFPNTINWWHYPLGSNTPDRYGLTLELINPQDLITVDQLVTHFRASSVPVGSFIRAIGIADGDVDPFTPINQIAVNIVPSGGVIDFTKSLSGLILPTKNNAVVLVFNQDTTLTIESWKNDMLYTTQGTM